ncbi:DUF3168 domain-containing protein [Parapedomonas caeni]
MASAQLAVQKAVYDTLRADPGLMAAVTGVFDHVPDGQPLPYVQVGENLVSDWSAKDFTGREHRLSVHVWSHYPGQAQARALLDLVDAALEHAPALLDGHRLVGLRFLAARVLRDADGETHHGIADYRARTVMD